MKWPFFGRKPPAVSATARTPAQPEPLLFNGQPIPVYPDRGPSVPAVPPEQLLASQAEQIRKLHHDSALSHEEFQSYLLPVVRNYAAYVHLLPASEVNHHCGQGGLLRHGLEVATNAARLCNNRKFAMDQVPSLRHHLEPRWRACALIGGMLHDMGKPLIDIGAVDDSGQIVWAPHSKSLWDWLCEHRLSGYRIQWRSGDRYKRHEALNAIPTYRIIPDTTMSWLLQYGSEPMDQLVLMLSGSTDPRNPYSPLVKQADQQSVSKDLKAQHVYLTASAGSFNRSLAARLFRAMHDLLESGRWIPNRPGSPIWVTTEGIVGLYPAVFQDALDVLRNEDFSPLPNDYAALLELFADWGYIAPNQTSQGSPTITWNMAIQTEERGRSVQVKSQVIRFTRTEVYPGTLPQPPLAPAVILDAHGQPMSMGSITPPTTALNIIDPDQPPLTPASDPTSDLLDFSVPSQPSGPLAPQTPVQTVPVPEHDRRPEPELPLRDRASETDLRDEAITTAQANFDAPFPPVDALSASRWLHDPMQDPHGPMLFKIAERVRAKTLRAGLDVIEVDGQIHLSTITCFADLGLSPITARQALDDSGWTSSDSQSRTTVDLLLKGRKTAYSRLTRDISTTFLRLMESDGIVLTQRDTRKERPVAWGPHLPEAHAAFILENPDNLEAKSIILKKALYAFAVGALQSDPRPMADLPPDEVRTLYASFLRTHPGVKVRIANLDQVELLTASPNPLLLGDAASNTPVVFNPRFDAEVLSRSHQSLFPAA